jgi:two-component system sensor histidine kinase MprB
VTFRLRLALLVALAVATTLALASGVIYVVMRSQLRNNLDEALRQDAIAFAQQGPRALHTFGEPSAFSGGPRTVRDYLQLVDSTGTRYVPNYEAAKVPISSETIDVARGRHDAFYADTTVAGVPMRIFTVQYLDGVALQIGRPLDEVNRSLHSAELILLLVVLGGLGVGAAGGALVSRTALVPVRRLTTAAEHIARTGDPSERVPEGGTDELGRLGSSFNTMLAALEESLETQKRFVADASHELRTPLTSLQTNIEVLRRDEAQLDPAAREQLLGDLHRESQEMRSLIAALLELARGESRLERKQVQLDEVVESAVERARARFPQVRWEAEVHPVQIEGYPERLERAVWNLLENAGKWSDDGSQVEVTLTGRELRVRDHGPGIAPEDRPLVFDRFYRSVAARSMPGSGLGLAIVREVAEAHGGHVWVEDAPGGGALVHFSLNGGPPQAEPV